MSPDTAPAADPADRSIYRQWTPVSLRFSDQDELGHVNNVAYAAYVEQGRVDYINRLLTESGVDGLNYILASVKIDYVRESHFPGTVDVGSRMLRVGTKSITTGYGMFIGDELKATAESVNVIMETESRKTVPMPDDLRAVFERELAGG